MTPRGGRREGAGRPAKGAGRGRQVSLWLDPRLADWATAEAKVLGISRSVLVDRALEALQDSGAGPPSSGETSGLVAVPERFVALINRVARREDLSPDEALALIFDDYARILDSAVLDQVERMRPPAGG